MFVLCSGWFLAFYRHAYLTRTCVICNLCTGGTYILVCHVYIIEIHVWWWHLKCVFLNKNSVHMWVVIVLFRQYSQRITAGVTTFWHQRATFCIQLCNAGSWLMICISLSVYFMGIKCFTHINFKPTSMESVHRSFYESGCSQIITVFQHTSVSFLRLNVPGRLPCVCCETGKRNLLCNLQVVHQ